MNFTSRRSNGDSRSIDELVAEFEPIVSGANYPAVEGYRTEDAEIVFVMMGSFATKARAAVDRLRDAGWRMGLVRPRVLRPYPTAHLRVCSRASGAWR